MDSNLNLKVNLIFLYNILLFRKKMSGHRSILVISSFCATDGAVKLAAGNSNLLKGLIMFT